MNVIKINDVRGVIGLEWRLLHEGDELDVKQTLKEVGTNAAVFVSDGDKKIQCGLTIEKQGIDKLSFAHLLAAEERGQVVYIHPLEEGYWLAAVSNGTVMPGLDLYVAGLESLVQRVHTIAKDDFFNNFNVITSDDDFAETLKSEGINVDVSTAFVDALSLKGKDSKRFIPHTVKRVKTDSGNPLQMLLLVGIMSGVAAGVYYEFFHEEEQKVDPEQLRREATAALHQKAKMDLTGIPASTYINKVLKQSKQVPGRVGNWLLDTVYCSVSKRSCDYSFLLRGQGSISDVNPLNFEGGTFSFNPNGKTFTLSLPMDASEHSVHYKAVELSGGSYISDYFVNGLHLLKESGVAVKLSRSRPPSIPNINMVDQSLVYKTGTWKATLPGNSLGIAANYYSSRQLLITSFTYKVNQRGSVSIDGVYLEK